MRKAIGLFSLFVIISVIFFFSTTWVQVPANHTASPSFRTINIGNPTVSAETTEPASTQTAAKEMYGHITKVLPCQLSFQVHYYATGRGHGHAGPVGLGYEFKFVTLYEPTFSGKYHTYIYPYPKAIREETLATIKYMPLAGSIITPYELIKRFAFVNEIENDCDLELVVNGKHPIEAEGIIIPASDGIIYK